MYKIQLNQKNFLKYSFTKNLFGIREKYGNCKGGKKDKFFLEVQGMV